MLRMIFVGLSVAACCFAWTAPPAVATPVTSGLIFHLDAQAINPLDPLQIDGGGRVIRWYDQSGTGNTAGQLTPGFRPYYVADGGAAFNHQPVVQFVGAQQTFVDVSSTIYSPKGSAFSGLTGQSGATVFTVFNTTTAVSNSVVVNAVNAAGSIAGFPRVQLLNSGGARFITGTSNNAYGVGTQIVQLNQTYLFSSTFDGSLSGFNRIDLDINGAGEAYSSTSGSPAATLGSIDRMLVGIWSTGQFGLTGNVAEVLIFDRVLSPYEYNQVGGYLEQKYNLNTLFIPVPEPSTFVLLTSSALAAVGGLRFRRR